MTPLRRKIKPGKPQQNADDVLEVMPSAGLAVSPTEELADPLHVVAQLTGLT